MKKLSLKQELAVVAMAEGMPYASAVTPSSHGFAVVYPYTPFEYTGYKRCPLPRFIEGKTVRSLEYRAMCTYDPKTRTAALTSKGEREARLLRNVATPLDRVAEIVQKVLDET